MSDNDQNQRMQVDSELDSILHGTSSGTIYGSTTNDMSVTHTETATSGATASVPGALTTTPVEHMATTTADATGILGRTWGVETNATHAPAVQDLSNLPGSTSIQPSRGTRAIVVPEYNYDPALYTERLAKYVRDGGDQLIGSFVKDEHWNELQLAVAEAVNAARTENLQPPITDLLPIERNLGNADIVKRLQAMLDFHQRLAGGAIQPDINVVVTAPSDVLRLHSQWFKRHRELTTANAGLSEQRIITARHYH